MAIDDQHPHPHPNSLSVSVSGREQIKKFLPFDATPQLSAAGIWVIGYQHALRPIDQDLVQVDEALADHLLAEDLRCVEIYLNATVRVPLEQHEFDALVSLVFDVGMVTFEHSALRLHLNDGDKACIPEELRRFGWQRGRAVDDVFRREAEADLFAGRA